MSIIRAGDMNLTDADVVRCASAFGIESLKSIGGFENALFMSTNPGGRSCVSPIHRGDLLR